MTELLYPITYRDAQFEGPDDMFRLTLTREWDHGAGTALWLLSNPSKASGAIDDPTALRVAAFSQRWGFRRSVIVNGSPLVATLPADNQRWLAGLKVDSQRPAVEAALRRNAAAVHCAARSAKLRVAAFGRAANPALDHLVACLLDIGALHCIGITETGLPKHPLARGRHRVPVDALPTTWKGGRHQEAGR